MKKVLCALLTCCMVLSGFSIFAADSTDVQMQKALAFVKSKVDVPQELNDFSYQKNDSSHYGGKATWSFRWANEEHDKSISVETVADEQIIYYQKSDYSAADDSAALAKVTKSEGEQSARQFLHNILSASLADALELTQSGPSGNEWNYSFVHMVNGLKVTDHTVQVNVSKSTGEVTWFRGFYENGSAYPDASDAISEQEAQAAFAESIGLELVYRSNYDYRDETLRVFPAYVLDTNNSMVMADGSIKQINELIPAAAPQADREESGGGSSNTLANSNAFTPEELAEIEKAANLISKEEAVAKVTAAFPAADGATLKSASLSADTITEDQYCWSLSLEKDGSYFYASVIANNGQITSYSGYRSETEGTLRSEETAKATLDTLLQSICAEQLAQSKLQETEVEAAPLSDSQEESPYYSVRYVRQANGIPFVNNTISATYNRKTGNVEWFNCTWYPDAQFPDLSNCKSETDMLNLLFDSLEYGLIYRDFDGAKYLCYDFAWVTNALFDPVSGSRIGYDGEPIVEQEIPVYTDIEGHWCQDMALALLENGVYFEGGKLNPESNVTQADFLRLLYASQQWYAESDNDAFYQDVVRRGILSEEEINPAGTVTRAAGARYIIRLMGYDKVAQLPGIFQYPFADTVDPTDVGYVTLCYGFGILKGDEQGYFHPDQLLTRSAAISMVYYKMMA